MSVKAVTLSLVAAAAMLAQPAFAQAPVAGATGATGAGVAGMTAATAAMVGGALLVVATGKSTGTGTR